jgi:membrane protein
VTVLRTFYEIWTDRQLGNQAAALAFYAVFAIAPLLVLIIELVGFVPGLHHTVLRDRIFDTVSREVGAPIGAILRGLVDAAFARSQEGGIAATVVSWFAIALAATGLFSTIQGSLESIWRSTPHGGIVQTVLNRAISFAAIGVLAIAALLWIAAAAAVSVAVKMLPGVASGAGLFGESLLEWVILSLALAVLFKVLPHADLRWTTALKGAAVTGAFIVAGQYAIGWYLNRSTSATAYGVAGTFVALMLWIYYSSQLFLAGAALTRALSCAQSGVAEPAAASPSSASAVR